MNPFKTDKDLVAKFEASQAEVAEHEATLASREEEIKNLSEQLATVNADLETSKESMATLSKDSDAVKAELETVSAELVESKEAQEDFDSKVSAAAQVKMAEMGIKEPVEESDTNDEQGDLYAQYKQLQTSNPVQARQFWKQNEEAIKSLR